MVSDGPKAGTLQNIGESEFVMGRKHLSTSRTPPFVGGRQPQSKGGCSYVSLDRAHWREASCAVSYACMTPAPGKRHYICKEFCMLNGSFEPFGVARAGATARGASLVSYLRDFVSRSTSLLLVASGWGPAVSFAWLLARRQTERRPSKSSLRWYCTRTLPRQ